MPSHIIQVKSNKLVSLKDDLIRMRKEILGSPKKIQQAGKGKKSFIEKLRKLKGNSEQSKLPLKDSLITDYFLTQRVREEQPFGVSEFKCIDVSEMTVGLESTFDGSYLASELLDKQIQLKMPAQHVGKVFDSVSSLCSSGDNSMMRQL